MKKRIYTIIFCFTVFITSCEDYLNVQPNGTFIPTTLGHFESLMIKYDLMQARSSFSMLMMTDLVSADDRFKNATSLFNLRRFVRTDFLDESTSESNQLWDNIYERIFVYNSIIDEATSKDIEEASEDEVKRLVAMARAARAYEYFDAVNAFGKSYNQATASTDLGVPIITSPNLNAVIPNRHTVQEVYDYMVSEMNEALPDLPETEYLKTFYPGKDMAYAFLARVYLFMHDYTKAKENATLALTIKSSIHDYNNRPFPAIVDNPEVIYLKERFGWINGISYASNPIFGGGFSLDSDFSDSFETGDIRLPILTRNTRFNDNGEFYIEASERNINVGLSVPELYLIRAECEARLPGGDLQNILDDLNTVRVFRFATGTYTDLTTSDISDMNEALSFVLDERKKELAFRDMRLFDMKRLMVTGDFTETLTRSLFGRDFPMAPNANNWVINIPLNVMDFNPDWEQNQRDNVSLGM
ncbi:RagB/SusD family nutrient uptake outer membrane protein [Flavivirga amylovorans]|uniref:RagB/SusD family nutrient uptake outer membrane protein n=1 Tax=Flavivirga amylovorans TaxID=870486 RepID=A0ABT8X0Z1_9FLAO|nr:RagB/SusD family nutrient uptake outer membrane protein [Flavivirga amylovorans]MDO5987618.1 RagB/SusD family nutrient uptake outer membrane protein [Flavivirga amylovorans]